MECLELLVLIQRKRQKKNEEMKREAELRKKYEENLDKPITITQRQFMEISAQVINLIYLLRLRDCLFCYLVDLRILIFRILNM